MGSSIGLARRNLHAALAARSGLADVQVTYGPPVAYEEHDVVSLVGLLGPSEDDAALGDNERDESYRIQVLIKAHRPAGDALDVDARGFALAEEVRGTVAADRTLGGAVWHAAVVSTTCDDGVQPADGGGFVIFLEAHVLCRARIT